MSESIEIRLGSADDAVCVAALATQVFLDAYATDGVRPDLAREAFREYCEAAFAARLAEPERRFILATQADALLGFAEMRGSDLASPIPAICGAELDRLYVQPRAQRSGTGRALIQEAERIASMLPASWLWLTVWDGNAGALAFYRQMGYADSGATTYLLEGKTYGNRVLGKQLAAHTGRRDMSIPPLLS
jgi:ribosomal protein S18 acetylase RimI-like enzyme